MKARKAFSLIELLIVVTIISILAAIALVNFQEARTRSVVSRVKADMRTIAGALEAYRVDQNAYPPAALGDVILFRPLVVLQSPVSYLTSVPEDPFGEAAFDFNPWEKMRGYNYKDRVTTSVGIPGETYAYIWHDLPGKMYLLHSCGPNQIWDVTPYHEYDPTNGTVSSGDISLLGP